MLKYFIAGEKFFKDRIIKKKYEKGKIAVYQRFIIFIIYQY